MASKARVEGLSTFAPSCSVVVMDSARATAIAPNDVDALFQSVVRGERGQKLRTQLAGQHPDSSAEEIEEAIQVACKRFVDKAEGISAPGQVYTWIRTTAHRVLGREAGYQGHERPVDPSEATLQALVSEEPGPEQELIAHEDEADLTRLAEEVSSALSERRRDVLSLYGAGYRAPEIASRLGLPERTVKYDLHEIIGEARGALAELSGGGCERGEALVLRFVCGLANSAESVKARLHLSRCQRCELFSERLNEWREKAGALLPVPALEGASPGVLARLTHCTAEGFSSVKQQVLGGASQVKQQASATYYRAVDPTPLAAARPGTVAAVVASCVTIGGGAATYCVNQGVDPIGAATGLIAGTQEPEPKPSAPPPETTEVTPVVPPAPVSEEPAATEAAPPAEAEQEPQAEPPPPPPEQIYEPSSPDYPATESSAEYQAPESASAESAPAGSGASRGSPTVWRSVMVVAALRSTRVLPLAITLAVAAFTLTIPSRAAAGEFTIEACLADGGDFASTAFEDFATRGMRWRRACDPRGPGLRGLVTSNVVRSGRVARGAQSAFVLSAPPGTAFSQLRWSGHAQRRDCRYALQLYAERPDGSDATIKNVRANRGCPRRDAAQASSWPRPRAYDLGGAARIVQRVVCVGASSAEFCSARGLNYIQTFTAEATVVDSSGPSVAVVPNTPLARGEWVSGTQAVDYEASDNVGVKSAQVWVGNSNRGEAPQECDYALRIPCPNSSGQIEVETEHASEGPQPMHVSAVDAAGNSGESQAVTARIDNTPPGTVAIGLEGGEAWRNRNDYAVAWENALNPIGRRSALPTTGSVVRVAANV